MTTEKKNSPSDQQSKAELDAQRVAQAWPSAPTNAREWLEAALQFRDSLDHAIEAVQKSVSEAHKACGKLRDGGSDMAADLLEELAKERERITQPAFRKAAQRVVDVVFDALVSGSPGHVYELERALFSSGRGRAEWGRLCSFYGELLRNALRRSSSGDLSDVRRLSAMLVHRLGQIDEDAKPLTVEQVIEAAKGKTRKASGFAGRLASDCGAFGYGPGDQEKAQRAFRKAMEEAT
jgi:hypothetical protein